MTRGRSAHLAWPETAKGNAPRGRGGQRREQRGSATADDQCSRDVRACKEEGKKNRSNRKLRARAKTHRGKRGGRQPRGMHRRKAPQKNINIQQENTQQRASRQQEFG